MVPKSDDKSAGDVRLCVELMNQSILARAFRGNLSAEFREAVKNWKDMDAEACGR
ncbi:MAG: hypothetical protein OIN88_00940 [Candidatus Methanoperedens sp.]|nr:hypothetical protein [Candidatus Methanoperedens sp.]